MLNLSSTCKTYIVKLFCSIIEMERWHRTMTKWICNHYVLRALIEVNIKLNRSISYLRLTDTVWNIETSCSSSCCCVVVFCFWETRVTWTSSLEVMNQNKSNIHEATFWFTRHIFVIILDKTNRSIVPSSICIQLVSH